MAKVEHIGAVLKGLGAAATAVGLWLGLINDSFGLASIVEKYVFRKPEVTAVATPNPAPSETPQIQKPSPALRPKPVSGDPDQRQGEVVDVASNSKSKSADEKRHEAAAPYLGATDGLSEPTAVAARPPMETYVGATN